MAEPMENPAGGGANQERKLHEELEKMLEAHKEGIKPALEAKERLKEAVRERIEAVRPMPPSGPPGAAPVTLPELPKPALRQLKQMPEERQVHYLVQLALTEGLEKSVSLAENLNSPYILDEFHDLLVDRLWQELVSRGLVNPNI